MPAFSAKRKMQGERGVERPPAVRCVVRERVPPLMRLAWRRTMAAAAAVALQACSSLLHVPDGATYRSADAQHAAVVRQGRVVVDGRPGTPQFDGIADGGVVLSRDGKRVAYVGMRGSKTFLVVDDREHGPFDAIARDGVQMSADGRRVALKLVRDGRWHLWLDGDLSKPYDGIAVGHPQFSADEKRVAYAALSGTTWMLVQDGVERPLGQNLLAEDFGFTADGELYAAYRQADGWRVRVGEASSDAFDAINKPGLMQSADRRATAFIARKGQQVFVCVNLVCGRAHRGVGARVQVDSSSFGDELFKAVLIGAVSGLAGLPASATNPLLTTPVGGGGGHTIIVGSVVFSPDNRHHAYVATDEGDAIMLDGAAAVPVPAGKPVDWMRFDDSSQVLMYRTAGSGTLQAAPLPGAPRHEGAGAGDPARAASVNLRLPDGDAVVFVDGRFAGVSPRRLSLTAGEHVLRVQAPGRASRSVTANAAPGQDLAVDLDAAADPVRAAVSATIARFNEPKLPAAAKARPDELLRGRVLAQVPLSEEVLGIAAHGAGATR